MRNFLAFSGILVLCVLVLLLSRSGTPVQEAIQRISPQAGQAPALSPPTPSTSATATISSRVNRSHSVSSITPSREAVRKEVAENPHATPPSLLRFGQSLAPMMDEALRNPTYAAGLVREFRDCAWDESTPEVARAVCLSNARRLAKVHPALQAQVDQIDQGTSKRVLNLAEVTRDQK